MSGTGWIGSNGQVLHFLRVVGADRDEQGRFLVRGNVMSYMGLEGENNDAVVAADTEYFIDGEPRSLVGGLVSTSYGMSVTVIGEMML